MGKLYGISKIISDIQTRAENINKEFGNYELAIAFIDRQITNSSRSSAFATSWWMELKKHYRETYSDIKK